MTIPEFSEKYIDFIGFYENVLPQGFCQHVISEFDKVFEQGLCGTRKENENARRYAKSDSYYFINANSHEDSFGHFHDSLPQGQVYRSVRNVMQEGLQKCFDAYTNYYDVLQDMHLQSTHIKIQKTNPGEGYHVWHSEQGNGENAPQFSLGNIFKYC